MRSLKVQILALLLGALLLLSGSFMAVLGWHMKERAEATALIKAKTDLATCSEIVERTYPGLWRVQDGLLYKGEQEITNNTQLVDHLAALTGDTVTFFLGDTRVATTVRGPNGDRATGTKVSDPVAQMVLKNGQTYLGQANVVGQIYRTAYEPLRAQNGTIIGMFYVGVSHSFEQEMVGSLSNMGLIGGILTLLVALLGWFFVQKVIIRPLHKVALGTRDVATGHVTQKLDITGPKEIGELTGAFNQMVERLETMAELKDLNPLEQAPVDQETVSNVLNEEGCIGPEGLPKGLNVSTLKQIVVFLQGLSVPVSSETVAEGVKLTRVTVRRYLEFLEQCGMLKGELKYGAVGRPVKLYSMTSLKP